MSGGDRGELELFRALLAQARADRDRLQEHVLALEDNLRWLRKVPMLKQANYARRSFAQRRPRPAPKPADGVVRPGRYLDVTVLQNPARSGIARVTVGLARHLDCVPVVFEGATWRVTRDFDEEIGTGSRPHGEPLGLGPGVIVINPAIQLGDDFDSWQAATIRLRGSGARYVQVVHDLLPEQLPDFFDYGMRRRFPAWLEFVCRTADLVMCDSATTESDLLAWAAARGIGVPLTRVAHPGSIALPAPSRPMSRDGLGIITVGTIEPRKSFDVVVAAVQRLRAEGPGLRLTIVGREGWADPAFTLRLRDLSGEPWFTWLDEADDQALADAYAAHDVFVAASRGEGYGLPLIEARRAGLRVVARDLPVFREVLGGAGEYFSGDDGLSDALRRSLAAPALPAEPGLSWSDAAERVSVALGELESA